MNIAALKSIELRKIFEEITALSATELAELELSPAVRDTFLKYLVIPDGTPESEKTGCWGWSGTVTRNSTKPRCFMWDPSRKTNVYPYRVAYALVHRLKLSSFPRIRHICPGAENPMCCNFFGDHIKPGTAQENADDRVAYGTVAKGDRNGSRTHPESRPRGIYHSKSPIKDPAIVQMIRATYNLPGDTFGRIAALARYLKLPECVVSSVVNKTGRGYREIADDNEKAIDLSLLDIRRPEDQRDERNGATRIPNVAVELFYLLFNLRLWQGHRLLLLNYFASALGVSPTSLDDIGNRRSRRHLTEPLDDVLQQMSDTPVVRDFTVRFFDWLRWLSDRKPTTGDPQ